MAFSYDHLLLTITCPRCGDRLQSWHEHDERRCACGIVCVSGGPELRHGRHPALDPVEVKAMWTTAVLAPPLFWTAPTSPSRPLQAPPALWMAR